MFRVLSKAGIALVLMGAGALAQDIVTNGNFGADSTAGNTVVVTNPTGWTPSGNVGVDSSFANVANFPTDVNDAFFDNGSLAQTLATTIGTTYLVSFYVGFTNAALLFDPTPPTFDGTFDSVDLVGGAPIGPGDLGNGVGAYSLYTATVTAASASTQLVFTGVTSGQDGDFYLADVSITAQSTPVPEPSGGLLVASALGMFGLIRHRRA